MVLQLPTLNWRMGIKVVLHCYWEHFFFRYSVALGNPLITNLSAMDFAKMFTRICLVERPRITDVISFDISYSDHFLHSAAWAWTEEWDLATRVVSRLRHLLRGQPNNLELENLKCWSQSKQKSVVISTMVMITHPYVHPRKCKIK